MDTLVSLSNALARAVELAGRAVVAVNARRRLPSTGVHWRPGIIVTADHTVTVEEQITITRPDGGTIPASLAGRDPGTDLAVLRVDGQLGVAEIGDASPLKPGQLVLALGYGPRVSWGVISALGDGRTRNRESLEPPVYLDLTLYPGFSGGPLVDVQGRVVGITSSGLARHSRLGIPATTVTRVTDELLERGHVARGYLGLGMQPVRLPDALARALEPPRQIGLIVVHVRPDGPAARAGVLLGDVLVALGEVPVTDIEDVEVALGRAGVGASLAASLVRAEGLIELAITVAERPRRGR